MNHTRSNVRDHAVVIGASMAGLLATRVLSGHFGRVTLVERDRMPRSAEPRKGVPQGHHVHALLSRGEQILGQLFPDLIAALEAAGAVRVDMGNDVSWYHFDVWKARFLSGVTGLLFTRPLLEWLVSRRVAALPNVDVIDDCDVHGFTADADRTRVTGLTIQRRHGEKRNETLNADLVIDASGRGSQTPLWLESLGYMKPEESTLKIGVGYATRLYRRPEKSVGGWKALVVAPRPPVTRGGIIFSIEDNRWIVTLSGIQGDHQFGNDKDYLEFARGLPVPDYYRAIEHAEPLTPIALYKFATDLRRHYEKLRQFPEGLLVLGDAVCSLNPIYAQGMSVCALEAITLDACLTQQRAARGEDLAGLWRIFLPQLAKVVNEPWQLTIGEDLRYPGAEGPRPPGLAFVHWYSGKVHQAAAHDELIARRFFQVMHMLEPQSVLLRPDVVLRLVRAAFRAPAARFPEEKVVLEKSS